MSNRNDLPAHMHNWPKETQDIYLKKKKEAIASGKCVCTPPVGWCNTHNAFGCPQHCPKSGCTCGAK